MSPRPSTGVRKRIVEAAQKSFHEQGFHGSSLDQILERAGATKGGLYHHFSDKDALGAAVVNEELLRLVETRWGATDWHSDPVTFLTTTFGGIRKEHLLRGCPINSFAQEISFHNDRLRTELAAVFDRWIELIAAGIQAGIDAGTVRADVDADQVATYYLAVWEGVVALAKATRRPPAFVARAVQPLMHYLESLRS